MKLTEAKLKQMILQEMSKIPPHVPLTDPAVEGKIADLLTGPAEDVNMAAQMLKPLNLVPGLKENSHTKDDYDYSLQKPVKIKTTIYYFKVTQSFYDAIMSKVESKQQRAPRNWAGDLASWQSIGAKITISAPYNLVGDPKHRSVVLRSDEPYIEMLQITIIETVE